MINVRQDVSRLKFFKYYMKRMFPYNDSENAWISRNITPKVKARYNSQSLIISMTVALATALFSTLIPTFIYFSRLNLL